MVICLKLNEFEKLLNDRCVYWKRLHEIGDRIVYSVGYIVGQTLFEQGITIYVRNRGTETEEIYFVGGIPSFLFDITVIHPLEKMKDEIIGKCGFTLVEGYTVNPVGNFMTITGYVESNGKLVRKQFIAYIKDKDVVIKEVV